MTEKEIEEIGPAIKMDAGNRYMERIIMPNLFDMRARDRQLKLDAQIYGLIRL